LVLQVNTLMARVGGSLIDKRKGTVLLSRAEWELLRKYMDQLHANWMAEIRKNSTADETTAGLDVEQAFEAGWRVASEWAGRDDLLADIGSAAYHADLTEALKRARKNG